MILLGRRVSGGQVAWQKGRKWSNGRHLCLTSAAGDPGAGHIFGCRCMLKYRVVHRRWCPPWAPWLVAFGGVPLQSPLRLRLLHEP